MSAVEVRGKPRPEQMKMMPLQIMRPTFEDCVHCVRELCVNCEPGLTLQCSAAEIRDDFHLSVPFQSFVLGAVIMRNLMFILKSVLSGSSLISFANEKMSGPF